MLGDSVGDVLGTDVGAWVQENEPAPSETHAEHQAGHVTPGSFPKVLQLVSPEALQSTNMLFVTCDASMFKLLHNLDAEPEHDTFTFAMSVFFVG